MTYKHGKFFNAAGSPVPLEFGNKEQLKIIAKAEALREGVMFLTGYPFTCLCGFKWSPVFEEGMRIKCDGCKQWYEFCLYHDEVPCIKTISK